MKDIIVIGGGPAGLTAAIYGARSGKSVLLFEGKAYGGQISKSHKVENYPGFEEISGFELSVKLKNQAELFGAESISAKVISVTENEGFFTVTADKEYTAKAVIFALGTEPKKSGIEGEDSLIGKGLSYCATCDGNFFRGKDVAVIGGGNTALQDALYLSDICKKVYIVHRRDSFRAEKNLVQRAEKKENIELVMNSVLLSAEASPVIKSIAVENKISGEKSELAVNGLFMAIGQTPLTAEFSSVLPLDSYGYVEVGEDCTVKDGIYVCGDCRKKDIRQLTTATADGTVAATKAVEFLDS
ncbi:MAG: thioredoxin-disulfide reductase [Clostridia bacterium]|nr:thioredoxin-disulfide reductase [Clostridia bacterium]